MARQRKEEKPRPWVVGFAGSSGKVSRDNVKELLNVFIPIDQDIRAVIPDSIKRQQKTLMYAWNWLDGDQGEDDDPFEPYEYEKVPEGNIVQELIDAQLHGHEVYLVLAFDEDKDYEIARNALDNGIPVKDLTTAMDDLAISEEEEEKEEVPAATRQRGKPRGGRELVLRHDPAVVEAETTGPATIVQGTTAFTLAEEQLLQAIRGFINQVVRESQPGPVSISPLPMSDTVRAFTNDDGDYELAGDRKRKNGWKLVRLSQKEAEELNLV